MTRARPENGPAAIEVPYPPPAARVEVVPPKPEPGALWVDGEWSWQGKRWVWESGGWIAAPANAYFAPWSTRRENTGKLFFWAGAWFDEKGAVVPKPPLLLPALTSLGDEGAEQAPTPTRTTPTPTP